MWQLATSRQWCRKSSYKTANQVDNDAASCPTRRRFKSARCRKRNQVWSHTATRSSIIPQKCGSGNATIIKIKSAMMPQLVPYCFHSSIIPQECGSGNNDATIKINQDGDDAPSCPIRRRIKTATMPQVVLPDDESSRQWCRNQSRHDATRKTLYGLILLS
jgi:hypothetical protein